ncbi:putative 2-aminoethylphosphonate ABC transporter substrate-binding protein [filamentous cyanobacterium CCT1]|nr:putative 2-aminoethylphosphonate ABC transporter substrate-binding protein [filamentous cyanobacterium CCT1]PSN79247.1 putative 2-aminoethylphosphonate ABC transporter substrate-binding protein [filamentous cyanobacterium CCP4]
MAAASFAVVLFVAACAVSQEDLQQADSGAAGSTSSNDSSITVYTALEDDQISGYLESFQTQNPDITVNIVRDSTGIITAKLLAEANNPQADVVWGTAASSLLVAEEKGLLEPYAPAGVEAVNPRFRDDANPPTWVGIDVWMSAFCVNTVESEKLGLPIPKGWADLVNPVYKGHIVMSNPASSGTGFLSVSSILQNSPTEAEGWAYLDQLHANIAQYMHSGSRPCKAAGAGEFPIGISFDYRAVSQKNEGEPIQPVFPVEGSGWDVEANALIKKAEIKDAAKTFLDWAISPDVMAKYAESFSITSVKTDVPLPEGFIADPEAQLAENDLRWAAANRDRILEEWTKRYDAKSEPKT